MSPPRDVPTILVVDSEARSQQLACEVLRAEGYTCLNAAHALHAIQLCKQYPGAIHLLLTEDEMPWMDGPELAVQIRALRPHVRVLFMTSSWSGTGPAPAGVGRDRIQKPFTAERLLEKVRQVLGGEPDCAGGPASAASGTHGPR
ncbi:response regulator [Nitrospira sp. Kam-Ns4a]